MVTGNDSKGHPLDGRPNGDAGIFDTWPQSARISSLEEGRNTNSFAISWHFCPALDVSAWQRQGRGGAQNGFWKNWRFLTRNWRQGYSRQQNSLSKSEWGIRVGKSLAAVYGELWDRGLERWSGRQKQGLEHQDKTFGFNPWAVPTPEMSLFGWTFHTSWFIHLCILSLWLWGGITSRLLLRTGSERPVTWPKIIVSYMHV